MQRAVLKLAIFTLLQSIAFSQTGTPNPNAATFITDADVKAVLKDQPNTGDHDLKSVDIGKLNLSVGFVHHDQIKRSADGSVFVLAHHGQTETYIITSGSGTLVTGGTMVDPKETPKTSLMYTTYNGPTATGKCKDCLFTVVNVGDIVIIPTDVNHGWAEVPDHVDYLTVRPDPLRGLPAGYVNPAIKK